MKRFVLAVTGTIAGLAALLSFKTQSAPIATGALPSAALGTSSSAAAPSTSSAASATTGATATPKASATPKATTATPKATTSAAATAKSYVGTAITTRYGVVQVQVTVKGKSISNVAFVQLTSFDGRSQQINSYAGPQLLQETLSAQSANVDTISGATYTSDGYQQSLQSALDKAGL